MVQRMGRRGLSSFQGAVWRSPHCSQKPRSLVLTVAILVHVCMEEQSRSLLGHFSFFSFSSRRFVVSEGKKNKGKLLGLECKTTGLFLKVFIFLQSLFFFQ